MSELVRLKHLQKKSKPAKEKPSPSIDKLRSYGKKEESTIKIPKFFQKEKELLHRRNIRMLPEIEEAEGNSFFAGFFSGGMWGGKLTVPLRQIRSQIEQGTIDEDAIDSHLRYYLKRQDHPLYRQHLLGIAYICLKQARAETHKEKQMPLLFKTVDLLRMYIQYSDDAIDVTASTMIIHIFSTFPMSFEEKWDLEKEVFQTYVELLKTKHRTAQIGFGDKDNVGLRIKIARLSAKQKNYYDALVQFSKILEIYKLRREGDPQVLLNRVRTHAWIGNVFQELIHYAQPGKATMLVNFIYRYNRDNATRKEPYPITVLKRNDAIAMRQTKKDIIRIANEQYKSIESLMSEIGQVGYKVTDGVIAGLTQEKFRPHILKALKAMKGNLYNSQEEFFQDLEKQSTPKPNEAQKEKVWVYVSSDAENINEGVMLQLKRNNKWIDVCFESMWQLAKNYEFLDMGDEALQYAKVAYQILNPISDRRYMVHKRDILNYKKDLCHSLNLTFRHMSKRQLMDAAAEVRKEAAKMTEIVETEARDRHIATAKAYRKVV